MFETSKLQSFVLLCNKGLKLITCKSFLLISRSAYVLFLIRLHMTMAKRVLLFSSFDAPSASWEHCVSRVIYAFLVFLLLA
jgi:hypothetical protein